jgi:CHAT domain-containing protein/tetratricopeptide (TPR) repeat protein
MAEGNERLSALLLLPPNELSRVGSELDEVLQQALEAGVSLLKDGLDEAEPLLRQVEALAVSGGRLNATRASRILLGILYASRNDYRSALAWYGAVLALPMDSGDSRRQDDVLYVLERIAAIRDGLDEQDQALAALAQLFQVASEFGRADSAWSSAVRLAQVYLDGGQLNACLYFLGQAYRFWQSCEQQSVVPVARQAFARVMTGASGALYYGRKDYQEALRWAQRSLEIVSDAAAALQISSLAHAGLGENREAADACRAWIAVEPAEALARHNLGAALAKLGDDDAAVRAMTEAVVLDPSDLEWRLRVGMLLRGLGRFEEAVTELDKLISIGCEREQTESSVSDARPSDLLAYKKILDEGILPLSDQIDFALGVRAEIDLERKNASLVARDIEALLARTDPFAKALGYHYRGQLYELRDDPLGALTAYQDAIARDFVRPETYADLARLLLRLGRDEEAIEALEALAQHDRDPEQAIAGLNELLVRRHGDPSVLRVRGIANFHARHAQAARADLAAAIDGGESGWHTYLMLGLSLLLVSVTDGDKFAISIEEAMGALTEAVLRAADTDDPRAVGAVNVFRFLVDCAFGINSWLNVLTRLAESGAELPWGPTLPGLLPALLARARAVRLETASEWRAAAAAWEEAQTLFRAADFPVTGARTSLNIADNRLRLYELDAVATHLEIAETVLPLAAGQEDHAAPGTVDFDLEVNHLPFYMLGLAEYQNVMRLMHIALHDRSGNYGAALASIGDAEWLFTELGAADFAPGVSVAAVVGLAQSLRRAGERKRASALLERITTASSDNLTAGAWATLGTLRANDLQAQISCLDQAERLAARDSPAKLQTLTAMRAEAYLRHGRLDEALAILDQVQRQTFSSLYDELQNDRLRAEIKLGRGDTAGAVPLIGRVIDRMEEARQDLTHWELREAWSGTTVGPYEVAIRAAMAAGRPCLAFEYAERSRSRALLDNVSLNSDEVKELAMLIRPARDEVGWLEQLPHRLSPAEMVRLQALVGRYQADHPEGPPEGFLHPNEDSLNRTRADLIRRLRRNLSDMVKRLDMAKASVLRRQGLTPVTWPQLRATIGATYVAQYHVMDNRVLLFTGAEEEPEIIEVLIDLDDIESVLAQGEITVGGYDLRQVDLARFQSAAAPLVAPLASRVPPGALICLIPHDRLHAIPLHILEVDGEPLGLRNSISYWPSASILVSRFASQTQASRSSALVIGDPGDNLAHARTEAITVAQQLGVTPFLGRHVSKRLVLDTLLDPESSPALVHIAAHGTVETDGEGAGIVLDHSPSDSDHWLRDAVLTQKDLIDAKIPAALVVLSCCRTAGSILRPGDELIGLARAFLSAGTAAMVLSQWSVDDVSTSLLMREFYRLITRTQPADDIRTLADALREASRSIRSMTQNDVATAIQEDLADAVKDARTMRTVLVDSAALSSAEAFAPMRATLAMSSDKTLREAALEAEARRGKTWTTERDEHPFRHPCYWAPFVLVGDWRLPTVFEVAEERKPLRSDY